MKALFVELPPFEKYRANYFADTEYRLLQSFLMKTPRAGDVIQGTGGLRKLRWSNASTGKGKRGGTRIIYYWYQGGDQFWLFTLYGKNEATDLSNNEKKALKQMLTQELIARGNPHD